MRRSASVLLAPFVSLPDLKVTGKKVSLPKLDYPVEGGVKPVLSSHQLDLHFNKHHKAYVDKFNTIEAAAKYDGMTVFEAVIKSSAVPAEKVLFNQIAQHFNHSFYWKCITPKGAAGPTGDLKTQIEKDFGSVDAFKQKFADSGLANFGSGWTWLVYNLKDGKLAVTNTGNAGCPIIEGENIIPLLTADVWEHAYYVDFENRRADYLKEFWQVVNWEFVGSQFKSAQ